MNLLLPNIYSEFKKDSPLFRSNIDQSMKKINDFENSAKQITEQFNDVIKQGVVFSCNLYQLSTKLDKFNDFYKGDSDMEVKSNIKKAIKVVSEFQLNLKSLLECFNSTKKDMSKLQDSSNANLEDLRRKFQKSSDHMDSTESKSAAFSPKQKPQESIELDKAKDTARREWENISESFIIELDVYGVERALEIYGLCDKLADGMVKFYNNGHLFSDKIINWRSSLENGRDILQQSCNQKRNGMHLRNYSDGIVQLDDTNYSFVNGNIPSSGDIFFEGYLWRAPKKSWSKWQRRWFIITKAPNQPSLHVFPSNGSQSSLGSLATGNGSNNSNVVYRLECMKRSDGSSTSTVMDNLAGVSARRIGTGPVGSVNTDLSSSTNPSGSTTGSTGAVVVSNSATSDRRWLFELVRSNLGTIGFTTILLQAGSEAEADKWVTALRNVGWSNHSNSATINNSDVAATRVYSNSASDPSNNNTTGKVLSKNASFSTVGFPATEAVQGNHNPSSDIATTKKVEQSSTSNNHMVNSCYRSLDALSRLQGNQQCAECGNVAPKWASVNLGVLLCTDCSGAHRSLGVHVSKVRSINLDNWEPEMLAVMLNLGNHLINDIYEGSYPTNTGVSKPTLNSPMNVRMEWTRAKWSQRQFIDCDALIRDLSSCYGDTVPSNNRPDDVNTVDDEAEASANRGALLSNLLVCAVRVGNLQHVVMAVAAGAPINTLVQSQHTNHDDDDDDASTQQLSALHWAVLSNQWTIAEYLLLNGAKVDITSCPANQTPLHCAVQSESVLSVWLLLKHRANLSLTDTQGNDALKLAIATANANTVTLLRLQTLNDHTKADNLGSHGDETVNNVFRDFTMQAFDHLNPLVNQLLESHQ